MDRQLLDMEAYPRKAHFDYFRSLQNPYVGLTRQADVTKLYRAAKKNGYPLFMSALFAATRAANAVPSFRQRIAGEGIAQYERCRPSYTVALENETYCYCTVDAPADELCAFLEAGRLAQERAARSQSLSDGEDDGDLLFISCLPWLDYTALAQPTPFPSDSNPRISWGRMREENGRMLMPLTVLANHALVDGLHIARFYEAFDECVERCF